MHMQRCRVRFSPLGIEHYSMVEVTAQLSESPQEWNSPFSYRNHKSEGDQQ